MLKTISFEQWLQFWNTDSSDPFEWRTVINILELYVDIFGPNGQAIS